jgi:hypothetical protein
MEYVEALGLITNGSKPLENTLKLKERYKKNTPKSEG